MLAIVVATEGSGVESPFRGEGEVCEEHFLSTGFPGGDFPGGGTVFRWLRENRAACEKVRGIKQQNVEA